MDRMKAMIKEEMDRHNRAMEEIITGKVTFNTNAVATPENPNPEPKITIYYNCTSCGVDVRFSPHRNQCPYAIQKGT